MAHDEPVSEEVWLATLQAHYRARAGYSDSPTKYSRWAEEVRKRWTSNGVCARPETGGAFSDTARSRKPIGQ